MTFMVRAPAGLGLTAQGKIVEAADPDAMGLIPEGRRIPIDDAERLGITTEAAERARVNVYVPDLCPHCGKDRNEAPK